MNIDNAYDLAGATVAQAITSSAGLGDDQIADDASVTAAPHAGAPGRGQDLHCLGEVRRRRRVSARKAARLLGITVREVRLQERPSSDILVSDLYRWQEVLEVPVAELLNQTDDELSPAVRLRALLVRTMKTVRSIQEVVRQPSVRRLAENLATQLVEIMPELKEAVAWPVVGSWRCQSDLGQAFFRGLSVFEAESHHEPTE